MRLRGFKLTDYGGVTLSVLEGCHPRALAVMELILFQRDCFTAVSLMPFTAKSDGKRNKLESSGYGKFTNTSEAGSFRTTCQLRMCFTHAVMI